ncbi:serine hydrolase domain-containing protein [Streptomyces sp. NPDC059008]|uniref:serine hydrolase domain-containing protein n=1 Tax=unclassified Streptomyces TaxID=2593676 RepID=UPI0036909665
MPHFRIRLRRAAATAAAAGMFALPTASVAGCGGPAASVEPSPSVSTPASPDEVRDITPGVTRQLDTVVQRIMREAKIPGVTVGLWTPDGNYVRSFGLANPSNGQAMAPDLHMRIGSVTKTFTVTALLQLVDRHKVNLDDPIGKYVEGVPNGSNITLRELAGMRSGLFNYSRDNAFYEALTNDPHQPFAPQELLGYAFQHHVLFPPGSRFKYSNTNLILLGLVIEKVTGQQLRDYIKKDVLEPTGLDHTLLPVDATFPIPHAQGYTTQTANGEVQDAADWNPSWAWAAGAMISNLQDLRVWARTVATGKLPGGGDLISPDLQKQRLTTPPTPIPGIGYGLGIFSVQGWIGHNGSLPGYESLVVYLPSARATLVVLLNSDIDHDNKEPTTLLGEEITKIVTPGHVFNLPAEPASR